MQKTLQRASAVVLASAIGMATIAGVASASEPAGAPAAAEPGPVSTILGGVGKLLTPVGGLVDKVLGGVVGAL